MYRLGGQPCCPDSRDPPGCREPVDRTALVAADRPALPGAQPHPGGPGHPGGALRIALASWPLGRRREPSGQLNLMDSTGIVQNLIAFDHCPARHRSHRRVARASVRASGDARRGGPRRTAGPGWAHQCPGGHLCLGGGATGTGVRGPAICFHGNLSS